jgi:hypothetical protein
VKEGKEEKTSTSLALFFIAIVVPVEVFLPGDAFPRAHFCP